jgi:tryptophan-rich sensory protein
MNARTTLRFPSPAATRVQGPFDLAWQPPRWDLLAKWLLAVAAVAVLGAQFPPDAWFDSLRKPDFHPPAWVFAPVWTALYAAMAIAAWLVTRDIHARADHRRIARKLFIAQLLLNLAWAPLFFGLHSPMWAFIDISLLWFTLAATMLAFTAVQPTAAWLLLPYLLWVSFALLLNGAIWLMNT